MTTGRDTLIAAFEHAAEEARRAEEAYRKKAARRIGDLERERTTAFRRLNLIRAIAAAVTASEEPEAAARAAVRRELDWEDETPRQKEILDRLTPVFTSLAAEAGSGDAGEPVALAELRAFEAWFRETTGNDFYALFDRYVPVTPVVDF